MSINSLNILGVGVSQVNMAATLDIIDGWIQGQERHYVCVANTHTLMESQKDQGLRLIHNEAGMVTPDGMPLVWLSRLAGHSHVERVYGPDLLLAVCGRFIEKGYRHFLFGGSDSILQRLDMNLRSRFPGLKIVGRHAPPFRPLTDDENAEIVEAINRSGADIVWVGLGAPQQERWMAAHLGRIAAPVMVGVGAAFDFHAGAKRQAPRFLQRCGLEWAFRLAMEPRRLWRRYLLNNPRFVYLVVLQWFGLKQFPLATDEGAGAGRP